jgi:F0F1-type ATP synthase membrane subunit b/b'
MYRITAYVLPLIYLFLLGGLWILITAKDPPEILQDLKKVFDYSFIVMVAIFWAVYFLAKRNLFDPLVTAMERRLTFISGREEAHAQAEHRLQEARRTFDLNLKRVRENERWALDALRKELSSERDRALAALKSELQRDLDARLEALKAEAGRLRASLEPEIRRMTGKVVSKVLKRDVA